jgi:hypothetical protein
MRGHTESVAQRQQQKFGLLTPLVAHESEDGESQTNFTTPHANHYAACFVAYLGDEIPNLGF